MGSSSSGNSASKGNNSAFFVKTNDFQKGPSSNNGSNNSGSGSKTVFVCKHCGRKGHTIERCFKLIGFPPKDNKGFSQAKNSASSSTLATSSQGSVYIREPEMNAICNNTSIFSPEQISRILNLINGSQGAGMTANMGGVSFSVFHNDINWVIDSGANQHFTKNESILTDVVDISDLKLSVDHPNGSSANIVKIGNLHLSDSLVLFDVLVVPGFNINLISVHKTIKDNKICIIFYESTCYLQDLQRNMTLGIGNENGGLYYFNKVVLVLLRLILCLVMFVVFLEKLGTVVWVILQALF